MNCLSPETWNVRPYKLVSMELGLLSISTPSWSIFVDSDHFALFAHSNCKVLMAKVDLPVRIRPVDSQACKKTRYPANGGFANLGPELGGEIFKDD